GRGSPSTHARVRVDGRHRLFYRVAEGEVWQDLQEGAWNQARAVRGTEPRRPDVMGRTVSPRGDKEERKDSSGLGRLVSARLGSATRRARTSSCKRSWR